MHPRADAPTHAALAGEQSQPAIGLWPLARYFLVLGTTGFGGPIALVGYMQHDLVERRRWLTRAEFVEGVAFAQIAPGPLAAQLAMYIGYLRAGTLGATATGLAFVLPSFLMVLAISWAYVHYGGLAWMQAAFYGVGPVVVAIIARSTVKLFRTAVGTDRLLLAIFGLMAATTAVLEREIAWLFLACGCLVAVRRVPLTRLRFPRKAFFSVAASAASGAPQTELFFFFAKAGLFVFGSGLAIVPFLYGGVVHEHQWLTERQFLDAVAVAMITPGPVVITVAFIGYLVAGLTGAFLAAAGVFLPVYLVVILLGPPYRRSGAHPVVRAFVQGVTAAATGAIAGAAIVIARRSVFDAVTAGIALTAILVTFRWKVPDPLLISLGCTAGLLLHAG